jgi:hypothetical protein
MRCPKCHYLSFDPEPRCKNCGYDLEVADAELAFKAAEDYSDPVADLELRRAESKELAPVTLELRRDVPDVERAPARRVATRARKPAAVILDDEVWPARSTPAPVASDPPAPAPEAMFRIEPVRESIAEPRAAHRVPARAGNRARARTRPES